MRKVIMYTKNVCPNCDQAKTMLKHVPGEIDLEIHNIDEDEKAFEIMTEGLESLSTPTFFFPDTCTVIRGFEIGEIQEELGL